MQRVVLFSISGHGKEKLYCLKNAPIFPIIISNQCEVLMQISSSNGPSSQQVTPNAPQSSPAFTYRQHADTMTSPPAEERTSCFGSICNAIINLFRSILNCLCCCFSSEESTVQTTRPVFPPPPAQTPRVPLSAAPVLPTPILPQELPPTDQPVSVTPTATAVPSDPPSSTSRFEAVPRIPALTTPPLSCLLPIPKSSVEIQQHNAALAFLDEISEDPEEFFETYGVIPFFRSAEILGQVQNSLWYTNVQELHHFYLQIILRIENREDRAISFNQEMFVIRPWMIQYLLCKYDDLSQTAEGHPTLLLHYANSQETARYLLERAPAFLEQTGQFDAPPLLSAAQNNAVDVVAFLLQQGVNAEAVNSFGDTALHLARSPEMAGALLYLGGSSPLMTKQNCLGNTPLHSAAIHYTPDPTAATAPTKPNPSLQLISHLLAQRGADERALNEEGQIPFHCCHFPEAAAIFLQKDPQVLEFVNPSDGNGALHHAETPEMIAYLVKQRASLLETVNRKGQTPLAYAFEKSQTAREGGWEAMQVVKALIEKGANPAILIEEKSFLQILIDRPRVREEFWRKLFVLAVEKNPGVVRSVDSSNRTLLLYTLEKVQGERQLYYWDIEILEALIKEKADIAVSVGGKPLLHFLIDIPKSDANRGSQFCELVIRANPASAKTAVLAGQNALAYLVNKFAGEHNLQYWNVNIANTLITNGVDVNVSIGGVPLLIFLIDRASGEGWRKVFKQIVARADANIEVADVPERTVLAYACEAASQEGQSKLIHWHAEIIQALIEKGAKTNIQVEGLPLTHFLISKASNEEWRSVFYDLLSKKKLALEVVDSSRSTPLVYALLETQKASSYVRHVYIEIMEQLIAEGAQTGGKMPKGGTLREFAEKQKWTIEGLTS
jgi:ankyrin repeat protein